MQNKMAIISDTFESTNMLNPFKYPDFIPNKSSNLLATTRYSFNFNNDKHLSGNKIILFIGYLFFFWQNG